MIGFPRQVKLTITVQGRTQWLTETGFVAGITVLEIADSFLIESILGGWRPNHFVQGPLQQFIDQDNE